MKIIDSHCHLESPELYERIDSVIDESRNSGIVKIITSSVKHDQWHLSRELSGKFPEVEYSIGIHPWFVTEADIHIDQMLCEAPAGYIAIGEIGLDKKIESPDFALQCIIFRLQMEYAVNVNRPVIIHCRGAFNELIEILKETGVPSAGGIVHAFSGSAEIADILMDIGLSFSMGSALSYRRSSKRDAVLKKIYPDNLLIETDSPDMPPEGTEKPNVPSNILINLHGASELLGRPVEEIAEATTENAERIFKLKL